MKKIQIVGLGSMGKRRIRNLQMLGYSNIYGYDVRKDRCVEASKKYGIKITENPLTSTQNDVDILIISTWPDQHIQYIKYAVDRKIDCFVEASVLSEGYEEIIEAIGCNKNILAPSATMRFDALIRKTKELIDAKVIGTIINAKHEFSQYLPNWHPYESINDFYVSKKETGAAKEIVPFDLVYLTWFFGFPKGKISSRKINHGILKIEADEQYEIIFKTEKEVLVSMSVSIVSHVNERRTRIYGSDGYIELDDENGKLKVYIKSKDAWQVIDRGSLEKRYTTEEMYVNEIESFMKACNNKERYEWSMTEDLRILEILNDIEKNG